MKPKDDKTKMPPLNLTDFCSFAEIVGDISYKKYRNGFTEIMAAELRSTIIRLGEVVFIKIKENGDEDIRLTTKLQCLLNFWFDPIANEKAILNTQREITAVLGVISSKNSST